MIAKHRTITSAARLLFAIAYCSFAGVLFGEEQPARGSTQSTQVMESFPVRVVDSNDIPVPAATVTPWALKSGQGHSRWASGTYDHTESVPESVDTDAKGEAHVRYPYYQDAVEGVRTTGVSILVNHPSFAFPDSINVEVPFEEDSPFQITLAQGIAVQVTPTIEGTSIGTQDLFAIWSCRRSWREDTWLERNGDRLQLPPLRPGKHSVLLAKMAGEQITHFSRIVDFTVPKSGTCIVDVPLTTVSALKGVLSENVPRPIKNGRVQMSTLPPDDANPRRVGWISWVPIAADGTFVIDAWPSDEKIQVIALCDGFIATSGELAGPLQSGQKATGGYSLRPQIFDPGESALLKIEMTPLANCKIAAVDGDDEPVGGVEFEGWPNVRWWNGGSQVYCSNLINGERRLRNRNYQSAVDRVLPHPFRGTTDRNGLVTLQLPTGKRSVGLLSEVYELPISLGRRYIRTEIVHGEVAEVKVELQPLGTERLGDWDRLAGIVFGCSTREGRRICALPGVNEKMEEFIDRYREAAAQQDPRQRAEAYALVASAFADIDDFGEAARWYSKAQEQIQFAQSNGE